MRMLKGEDTIYALFRFCLYFLHIFLKEDFNLIKWNDVRPVI